MTSPLRLVSALLVVAASMRQASAHSGAGVSLAIHFQQLHDENIFVGTSFGAVVSHDGGATWDWVCERAIGYQAPYIPTFEYTASGAVFATTYVGLAANRDECTFEPSTIVPGYASAVARGPTGAIFMAMAEPPSGAAPGDSGIYRSDDDGQTFPIRAEPGQVNDWWESIRVAPSDPQRVYLTGYRPTSGTRTPLLFRSDDGGMSYAAMSTDDVVVTENSTASIVGVAPTDADIVYMKVTFPTHPALIEEAIYRSSDGGDTWTNILQLPTEISFVARANGDVVAGTQLMGTQVIRAPATGTAWEAIPDAPHISCLAENAAGELWACTANYNLKPTRDLVLFGSSDGAGVMRTSDLMSWLPVLRFQNISAPVSCPPETVQYTACEATEWCLLRDQLGIEANPTCCRTNDEGSFEQGCVLEGEVPPPDGPCNAGASGARTWLLAVVFGGVVLRRRRLRRRAPCGPRR